MNTLSLSPSPPKKKNYLSCRNVFNWFVCLFFETHIVTKFKHLNALWLLTMSCFVFLILRLF